VRDLTLHGSSISFVGLYKFSLRTDASCNNQFNGIRFALVALVMPVIASTNLATSFMLFTFCMLTTYRTHKSRQLNHMLPPTEHRCRTAFIPFLVACDPNPETTVQAIKALDALGADVIELGVPYSDPLADGPTIQAAATRALQGGTTLNRVLDVVREATATVTAPIVMFTYFNPIMARGAETFCRQVKEAGAAGLLVPDIPLEETDHIRSVATAAGIELVLLATPTTPPGRMERIAASSQGFVYLVSVTGVTGIRGSMESRVEGLVSTLKGMTAKSVAVGFGVSGPEQARQIKNWGADGVIVGSALVKALGEAGSSEEGLKRMTELARSIREAI
jgi:tryptophan synthase alpha chain